MERLLSVLLRIIGLAAVVATLFFGADAIQRFVTEKGAAVEQIVAPKPAARKPPPQPPTTYTGGDRANPPSSVYVQIASHRSTKEAAAAAVRAKAELADILNGSEVEVRKINLESSGVWYRIVFKVPSEASGDAACEVIKSRGGTCLVYAF